MARWPPLARLEALIRSAPPRLALALFLVPAVLLFPVKLGALWLMQQGQTMLGITIIVAAKRSAPRWSDASSSWSSRS
jgi:hypothetical protein